MRSPVPIARDTQADGTLQQGGANVVGHMHLGRIPNCSEVPNGWVTINMAKGLPCHLLPILILLWGEGCSNYYSHGRSRGHGKTGTVPQITHQASVLYNKFGCMSQACATLTLLTVAPLVPLASFGAENALKRKWAPTLIIHRVPSTFWALAAPTLV